MKAKFINENISDILKPKSKEEIEKHFPKEIHDLISLCYETIEKNKTFEIITELGINKGLFGFLYFGFEFINVKNNNLFTLLYNEEENSVLLRRHYTTDENESDSYDININNLMDFIFYFNLYDTVTESKSINNILRPKSEEEINSIISSELMNTVNNYCYLITSNNDQYIITDFPKFSGEGYYFCFKSLNRKYYGDLEYYSLGCFSFSNFNEISLIFENSGVDIQIHDTNELIEKLDLNVDHDL